MNLRLKNIFNNETTQKCQVTVSSVRIMVECGRGLGRSCLGRNIFRVWDLVCIKIKKGEFRDKTYISSLSACTDGCHRKWQFNGNQLVLKFLFLYTFKTIVL